MEPEPAGSGNAPLVVVVGETASGKSALGLKLAQTFDGEIITADSWTVYKGFDIGTAKPSAAERRAVEHHLLDIADPLQGFSAPQFQQQAKLAIGDITSRNKLPLLVGGTGLYIDSVLFDYGFLPAPKPETRQRLSALTVEQLRQTALDSGYDTTHIDLRNKRRIIRLLENEGRQPSKNTLRGNTLILGIKVDRDHLRERIELRVDRMFDEGLEAEVAELSRTYGWQVEPMKGIGYREWREYFAGTQNLEQTRARIISATMNLAKRQRTWFHRNNSIHWLSREDIAAEAVDLTTTFLNK